MYSAARSAILKCQTKQLAVQCVSTKMYTGTLQFSPMTALLSCYYLRRRRRLCF